MILTWMLAATLFALLIGVAARAAEAGARLMSWQARAPWIAALGVSLVWPVLLPFLARERVVHLAPVIVSAGGVRAAVGRLPSMPLTDSPRIDYILAALWIFASLILIGRLVRAQRVLAQISRSAQASELDGHDVLVTERVGPAVVGIVTPRVAVPAWLAELDLPLRQLVLRHEREHCRARDTVLLWLGELSVVLMPWNPAIWWQSRRLRLALELDCDARTVHDTETAATYGKLLLLIAQRQHMTRLAPMLAESNSHLSQRIAAMSRQSVSNQPLRAAVLGGIAVVAIVAACSNRVGGDLVGPQPVGGKTVATTPTAPAASARDIRAANGTLTAADSAAVRAAQARRGAAYFEYKITKDAAFAPGSAYPKYPDILKQAGVEGKVVVGFVVDTTGLADANSIKIFSSSHQLFANAVVAAVPNMRFTPALVDGHKVRQLLMEPFVFSMSDTTKASVQAPVATQFKVSPSGIGRGESSRPPVIR